MYEMKPEYYIGIDMIDEEHKQLFKYTDEAYEQIMGILKYLTEWLVNHILYVDGQIAEFVSKM